MKEPRRGDWSDVPVDPALAERSASMLAEARAEPWSAEARARVQAKVVASAEPRRLGWGVGGVVIVGIALAGGAAAMWGSGRAAPEARVEARAEVALDAEGVSRGEGAASRGEAVARAEVVAHAAAARAEAAAARAPAESTAPSEATAHRDPAPTDSARAPTEPLASRASSRAAPPVHEPAPSRATPPPPARERAPAREPASTASDRPSMPTALSPDRGAPLPTDTATAAHDGAPDPTALALRAALDHLAAGRLLAAHDVARSAAAQHAGSPLASELHLVQLEAALRLRRPRFALAALADLDIEAQPRRVELTVLSAELWAAIGDCPRARTILAPILADATTSPELRARAERTCR